MNLYIVIIFLLLLFIFYEKYENKKQNKKILEINGFRSKEDRAIAYLMHYNLNQ